MDSFIDIFTNSETSTYSFVNPKPSQVFAERLRSASQGNDNVRYMVFSKCIDNAGTPFLQGFVQTAEPFSVEMLINLFGFAIYRPCNNRQCQTHVLTEIHMSASVHEFGDIKSINFEEERTEINAFKQTTDIAMQKAIEEIQQKHFNLFQAYPHLVLRHIQN